RPGEHRHVGDFASLDRLLGRPTWELLNGNFGFLPRSAALHHANDDVLRGQTTRKDIRRDRIAQGEAACRALAPPENHERENADVQRKCFCHLRCIWADASDPSSPPPIDKRSTLTEHALVPQYAVRRKLTVPHHESGLLGLKTA